MRKITYILALMLWCSVGFAQTTFSDFDKLEIDSSVFRSEKKITEKNKVKFGVDVGMSYMFSSNGLGGPSLNLSPHLSYPVAKKMSIVAGVTFETGSFMVPTYAEGEYDWDMLPMTRMFVYAGGNYSVNEKMTVSGTVYKQIMDVPNPNRVEQNSDYDFEGMSVGVTYKLTENITIGAQVRVESPHDPWYNGMYQPGVGIGYPNAW